MAGTDSLPPLISKPDEDGRTDILVATLLVTCLATITVFTRLYVRLVVIRSAGWDDAFMTLAMALAWAGQGVIIVQVAHGAGRHIGDVDPDVYMVGMMVNFISQPIFLFAICVVKLAVGSSLLRIASTKMYRVIILSIMGFMVFYTVGCFFTIVFQCTDIRVLWDTSVKSTCWSRTTLQGLSYTNSALNILTDLLFAVVIPAPMLWRLNVHPRTRISLLGVLSLGVFACAAAFVKLGYIANYGKLGDWLWDSRNITIWTTVELNVGIVAGSLPCLRPLFKRWLGSIYARGSSAHKTPTTGARYGTGTMQSGSKNWHTLGSGRRGPDDDLSDDTSSQRAINCGPNDFELRDRRMAEGGILSQTTVLRDDEEKKKKDSEEEDERRIGLALSSGEPAGITKTTVTTVEISESRFYP